MLTLIQRLFILTAALQLSSCAIQIRDEQFCSPIPGDPSEDPTGYIGGATCDNIFTANQLVLTKAEWEAKQKAWTESGEAIECTTSKAVADYKAEIEKLCSRTPCSYELKKTLKALAKILRVGEKARAMAR